MKVNTLRRLIVSMMMLATIVFAFGAIASPTKKPQHHNSGHALVGDKLKTNGVHEIDKKGKHHVSAEVKNGKIASFHVRHETKGEVAVKKYRSHKKMASADGQEPGAMPAQTPLQTDLGTVWIGYAYVDDDGNEEYYWFPYEEILDPDTGAIDYVADN